MHLRRLLQLGLKSFDLEAVEDDGCRIMEKGQGYQRYVTIFGTEILWLVQGLRRAAIERLGKKFLGKFRGKQDRLLEAWLLQNSEGKYISVTVTSMGDAHRICVPPLAFGDGWDGLARHLSEFLVSNKSPIQPNLTYAQAATRLKWPTDKIVVIKDPETADLIVDRPSCRKMFSFLDCCLVGQLADWHAKSPSVESVKEWVARKWQVPAEVEVVEFDASLFVFGFHHEQKRNGCCNKNGFFMGFRWSFVGGILLMVAIKKGSGLRCRGFD